MEVDLLTAISTFGTKVFLPRFSFWLLRANKNIKLQRKKESLGNADLGGRHFFVLLSQTLLPLANLRIFMNFAVAQIDGRQRNKNAILASDIFFATSKEGNAQIIGKWTAFDQIFCAPDA